MGALEQDRVVALVEGGARLAGIGAGIDERVAGAAAVEAAGGGEREERGEGAGRDALAMDEQHARLVGDLARTGTPTPLRTLFAIARAVTRRPADHARSSVTTASATPRAEAGFWPVTRRSPTSTCAAHGAAL